MSEVLQAFYKISPVLLIFEESRKTIASARSDDFRRRYCRKSNKRTVEETFQGKHLRTRTGVGAIFALLVILIAKQNNFIHILTKSVNLTCHTDNKRLFCNTIM